MVAEVVQHLDNNPKYANVLITSAMNNLENNEIESEKDTKL